MSTFWASNPHWQYTTMCPKKCARQKHWNGSQLISLDKVDQGCAIFIWKNFLKFFFVTWKSAFFPWNHHFRELSFVIFFQILVDHLPLLAFPQNLIVKWTSPNFGLEMWQRFCHPKIISYKKVPSKIPFTRRTAVQFCYFFFILELLDLRWAPQQLSNVPANSLWWLSWSRSYQMIVPQTRILSVPHTRWNSSERVCGTARSVEDETRNAELNGIRNP